MAEGIVYLDVDDEITSAASRIRSAPGTKVALVVPYGSRIATSRINFRLLSREAVVSNRRLSVIAGDAGSRALAASAGLPVFATIAEYEAALAGPKPSADADVVTAEAVAVTSAPEAAPTIAADTTAEVEPEAPARSKRGRAARAGAAGAAAGAAAAGSAVSPVVAPPVGVTDETRPIAIPSPPVGPAERGRGGASTEAPPMPVAGGRRRVATPVAVAIGAVALAVVVVGVGAYLLLPSATIAVTPREDPVGPISLTIAADPAATGVDAANSRIPAIQLDVPAEASQTFTTTGRHVEQSTASGSVTFTNYDTGGSNTVPSGSIVATQSGIRFKTLATVTLPAAAFFPVFVPSQRSVAVSALDPGPSGNVGANTIRVVPQGENPELLHVNNPNPTSGGSRTETPEIKKAEIDKAITTLQKTLQANFTAAVAAGAGAPAGAKVFPTTARIGTPAFDVDPTTLVGQALETFDLRISTTGTVIAVDPTPVRAIAEAQVRSKVAQGHLLVDGSIQIDVDAGSVGEDGQVTYQATARGSQVVVVDANQLRALVKGKTVAEAEAALQPYGSARVTLWPAWVTTVTGVDARLSISVAAQAGSPGSGASASPDAYGSPGAQGSPGASGSTAP